MVDQLHRNISVKKASGKFEPYNPEKLIRSLCNSGTSLVVAEEIAADVSLWLTDGMSTKKIYSLAFKLLSRKSKAHATRYNLKKALLELGNTGYPFEHLVGEIFHQQGYNTEVGIIVEGHCISHEMDVIATRENNQMIIECKYSQSQGKHVGIQVPLYVHSRVDDIIQHRKTCKIYQGMKFMPCVVTNTRFSDDSIAYAKCVGLKLIGWDYPAGNGLKEMLEKLKIIPITIVKNLTLEEKQILMDQGIITFANLQENLSALDALNINQRRYREFMKELDAEE